MKEIRDKFKKEAKSRLMYIFGVTPTADGRYSAEILCEDDFDRDGDYLTTLYKFLDNVVRCDIARYSNETSIDNKFRIPQGENEEDLPQWAADKVSLIPPVLIIAISTLNSSCIASTAFFPRTDLLNL